MEVIALEKHAVETRIAVEMGDNPSVERLDTHLREVHGLDPYEELIKYALAMDAHRAALIDGSISLAELIK